MPLRADLFEGDIETPASAPVILDGLNWVGHGGRFNWCWAACSVMIELFNEKAAPGTESEVLARLCKTANKILGGAHKKCCETDSCDEPLTVDQINELWEKNLIKPANHKGAPFSIPVEDLVHDELQIRRLPVEADITNDDLFGHVVVIYGFATIGAEMFFHMRDPAIPPSAVGKPHLLIPASALRDLCKNLWFDRPKED